MKITSALKRMKRPPKLVNELETNIEDYLSWYKKTIIKDLPDQT